MPCKAAASTKDDGRFVKTAGLVPVRQMPGTAKGVMFMTIEDETGVANLVIWKTLYEQQRRIALSANLIGVDARIQREGEVVHLVAYQERSRPQRSLPLETVFGRPQVQAR